MTELGQGIHALAAATYHVDPAPEPSLSSSIARYLVAASPLHAWWNHPRLNPEWKAETTNRLSLGALCHRLLLGAGPEIAVCEAPDWRAKDARQFRQAALERGAIPVTQPQAELATRIVCEAQHELQLSINGLLPERTWLAEEADGTWLRCMTDWMTPDGSIIYDYKTTAGSAEPRTAACRSAAQLGYDFQQAFYERVITEVKPELAGRLRFVFIFQEIDPPYALSMIELSEADIAIARRQVEYAVDRWAHCLQTDQWPGYPNRPVRVSLPEWRARDWLDREIEEAT